MFRPHERGTPDRVIECLKGLSAMVNSTGIEFSVLASNQEFITNLIKSLSLLSPYPRSHAIEMAAACCLRLNPEIYRVMLKAIEQCLSYQFFVDCMMGQNHTLRVSTLLLINSLLYMGDEKIREEIMVDLWYALTDI